MLNRIGFSIVVGSAAVAIVVGVMFAMLAAVESLIWLAGIRFETAIGLVTIGMLFSAGVFLGWRISGES